ncbi:MAG: gliding motility-associated C-terminal domain-containing protein, partial [Bacteroidetes bacterium]|nr:gliding motility-associated C-terminal domain-containing protein [Bacteroidota bacterium]
GGAYGNNQNFTQTWVSSSAAPNTHLTAAIAVFDVAAGDTLFIYDGNSTAAPLLAAINNTNFTAPGKFRASIYNPTGNLTFVFKSNASGTGSGWDMNISCGRACQQVIVDFGVGTIPPANSENYVDICFGDTVTFVADVSATAFPDNGVQYTQTGANTTWRWNFGDGTPDQWGQSVTHVFSEIRGYDIQLSATDVNTCVNLNALLGRVRVSGNPISSVNPLPDVCARTDTLEITVGYDPNSVIGLAPVNAEQASTQGFDSTMFIPDGPNCPVQCYNTDVTFNAFLPNQTITAGSDVVEICMNMEHSFVGDLEFTIYCPNGQSVLLKEYISSGGGYLGVPYGGTGHGSYDSGCNPSNNPHGTGWNYCWSELNPNIGTINAHSSQQTLDSTNTLAHTGNYAPDDPFSGLIGCPLNGTWSIEICDYWSIDNGYIFEWWLALDPSLVPGSWTYDVPIDTIYWSGAYIAATGDSSVFIAPALPGTYEYTLTVVDEFGCSYDTTLSATVKPNPLPLCNEPSFCLGGSAALNASGAASYRWEPLAGLSSSTGSTVIANPTTTTTYSLSVVGANGCTSSSEVLVTVWPLPGVSILPAAPAVCPSFSVDLTASGAANYSWTGSGVSPTTGSTVTATPAGTTTYNVLGTDGNGCTGQSSVQVTVYPQPDVTVTPNMAICENASAVLQASGGNSYNWTGPNLNQITGNSVVATPTITSEYCVLGTDINGCTDEACMEVTFHPVPPLQITPDAAEFCIGASAQLVASGPDCPCSYIWNGVAINTTTGATVVVNPTSSTTYTVTGTDQYTCTGSTTIYVTVHPLPVIVASPDDSICTGGTAMICATGGNTYTWAGNNLDVTTGPCVYASPLASNQYTVTGTDIHHCQNTDVMSVTVSPVPLITVNSDSTAICAGDSAQITVNGATSYVWAPPLYLDNTTGVFVWAKPPVTTLYTVTGTTAQGCTGSTDVLVYINPLPTASFALNGVGCAPITAEFFNNSSSQDPIASYIWNFGDGSPLSGEVSPVHYYGDAGDYDVSLVVTTIYGCRKKYTIPDAVHVYENPELIHLKFDPETGFIGETIHINAIGSSNIVLWNWDYSYEGGSFNLEGVTMTSETSHVYSEAGTYAIHLIVETINGCTAEIDSTYEIVDIQIPNVMTPNGDSWNDVFKIPNLEQLDNVLVIFNRWGRKVFEATNYKNDWGGDGVSDGTYYYVLTLQSGDSYAGFITIINKD